MTASRRELQSQLLRYLVVGGLAVVFDAVVYIGLIRLAAVEPAWAKRFSFASGAIWGFFANKFYTFSRREFSVYEPVLFTLVYLAGWLLNSLIHDGLLQLSGAKWLAFLMATGASTCTNFAGQKWLVFKRRATAASYTRNENL